jgi:glycosyltransferase involved in cell wall biosynthesis
MVVLSEWLLRMGHQVTAVCPPGGWLPEQLRTAGIPAVEMTMHGALAPSAIARLHRMVRETGVDVIHTHLTRATYMGYFAGQWSRVPVISTMHVATRDFAYRWLPRANHSFVAVSNHIRDSLIARGLSAARVHTVYNGTDLNAEDWIVPAQSLSVRAELGLPAMAEVVGQVGRVDAFKGAPILVRAAGQIVAERPNAYFVFVGHADPGIQQALWEEASSYGIEDRLRFIGVRNDVPRLLGAMDVVTLPSVSEACSMAIIEAMTMGIPVVATRAGGNIELVEDGVTGLLVERSSSELAPAVVRLLSDAGERRRMGDAAKTRARTFFTARVMASQMEGVYQRVLQTNS